MAVQIKLRRGTAAQWTSANPVLGEGEMGVATDTGQYKIGDGTTAWNSLSYQSFPSSTMDKATYTAKGVIAVASSANTPAAVTVGANDTVLVADSAQTSGVKWSATLSGLTISSPTVSSPTITSPTITGTTSIGTGATLTTPTVNNPTVSTGTFTSPTITTPIVTSTRETWTISATAPTGTINVDVATNINWYFSTNASASWTFNFRGDSGTTLSSLLSVGQSVTVGVMTVNGSTAYYPTAFSIDGTSVTPKWQGNAAPSEGNASGVDAYVFTIIKTAATPTYVVLASQTKFA